MSPRRLVAPPKTITLHIDGHAVPAIAGEPVAVALAASGRWVLSRSVKYHRPRGPTCFSGRCDGCLMRVDGVGSVMTCRAPARDGMYVETQNVLGSADSDLLSATDWFFPDGMNHHEMFTGTKLLNHAMLKIARRIAGIGELPSRLVPDSPPREASCDVLVIGGGPAGLAAAAQCARAGAATILVEEAGELGGHLLSFPGGVVDERGRELNASSAAEHLVRDAESADVRVLVRHAAIAAYEREVLVHAKDHVLRVHAKRIVVATGAHEGAMAFDGADLPGVIGVRAACVLLRHGVLPGERVAIVGKGVWSEALARALRSRGAEVLGPFEEGEVLRVRGRPAVRGIEVRRGAETEALACDCVAIAPPLSPDYELAAQAGAEVTFSGEAFVVSAAKSDGATAAAHVYAVGECTGVDGLPQILAQAREAGGRVAASLSEEDANV